MSVLRRVYGYPEKGERQPRGWAFWCPGCDQSHYIPAEASNGWTFDGNQSAPTFAPSVLLPWDRQSNPPRRCHLFVRSGKLEYLSDCSHALAGKTVDMVDIDEARAARMP